MTENEEQIKKKKEKQQIKNILGRKSFIEKRTKKMRELE